MWRNWNVIGMGYDCGRFEKLQQQALRVTTSTTYSTHSDLIFKCVDILKSTDMPGHCALKRYYKYKKMNFLCTSWRFILHDDVIKWKHFPRYWPFVRAYAPVSSDFPHKGQWRGVLMFSLICALVNGCVNNRDAGDLKLRRAHYHSNGTQASIHKHNK